VIAYNTSCSKSNHTMISQKRSRISLPKDPATTATNTIDPSAAGAKICLSLSKSLHDLLINNIECAAAPSISNGDGGESHNNLDVYHQYLNSPPRTNIANTINNNTNNDLNPVTNETERQWRKRGEVWLSTSSAVVGVGSSGNTLRFWKEHGRDHKEWFADGRYLVWFVKEILMGPTTLIEDGGDGECDFADRLMGALKSWHLSILQLLDKISDQEDRNEHNATAEEVEDASAGVMWQMLLQNAHLTPASLRDSLEDYTSPQENLASDIHDDDGGDGGEPLPAEYFAWPSFFRHATLEAAKVHSREYSGGRNKRRRNNDGTRRCFEQTSSILQRGEEDGGWWPLFGYAIAYAFLSSSSNQNLSITVEQKMVYLKERIFSSLPDMMNMPDFDCQKSALWSGMAACVLDEVGEWIVLDGLVLGEAEDGGGREEARMNAEVCDRLRSEVGPIVDLLREDGILPTLAKLTKTPLSDLVAESADALLNYSEAHHRLRLRSHHLTNTTITNYDVNKDDSSSSLQLQQLLANDARLIIHYIERVNPEFNFQLMRRKFVPRHYFSYSDSEGGMSMIPLHPAVVNVRARLITDDGMPHVSRMCHNLEDCTGIEDATKRHCWLLLFERMQDEGVLFEEGWNIASPRDSKNDSGGGRVGATLANITMGSIGLSCALEYLENVVVEAKASSEFLCVKDAVRRTVLKILLPRAYSPAEALEIATELSDARGAPALENTSWGRRDDGDPAANVACRILAAPSLYSVWNENVVEEEEVLEEKFLEDQDEQLAAKGEVQEELTMDHPTTKGEGVALDNDPAFSANMSEEKPVMEDKEDDAVVLGDTDGDEEAVEERQGAEGPPTKEVFEELETVSVEEEVGEGTGSDGHGKEDDIEDDDDDETKSIEESVESIDGDEPNYEQEEEEEKEKEEDNTYSPNHHEYTGNHSENDDYEEEDKEEADRRLAYEGEYDEEEGRGDSADDEGLLQHPVRPEPNDMVEILDSSEDEDMQRKNVDEDAMEEAIADETNDTKSLNEKVNRYIKSHEDEVHSEEPDDSHIAAAEAFDIMNESNDNTKDQEQQAEEARILRDAVHEYIVPTSGAKEKNMHYMDEGEETKEELDDEVVIDYQTLASHMNENVQEGIDTRNIEGNSNESEILDYDEDEKVDHGVEKLTDEVLNNREILIEKEEELNILTEAAQKQPTAVVEPCTKEVTTEGQGDSVEEVTAIGPVKEHLADEHEVTTMEDEHLLLQRETQRETGGEEETRTGSELDDVKDSSVPEVHSSVKKAEDDVPARDVPYSSDGNLIDDTDDMEMMADDEHSESIDTEDDNKHSRYLEAVEGDAEERVSRGETFESEEGGEVPLEARPSTPHDNNVVGSDAEEEADDKSMHKGETENVESQQPSILVAAAMSSQRQGNNCAQSASMPPRSSGLFELPSAATEGDNHSYDNTSAALASSAGANLWENYDDASQGGGTDVGAGSNIQVVARYRGHDLALDSVLDVHADVGDDTGEESSPEENVSVKTTEKEAGLSHGEGQILTDDGYVSDAEATEEEQQKPDNRKKAAAEEKPAIEDGYVSDADATEEEKHLRRPTEHEVQRVIVDEGYVPDASEASEVEQVDTIDAVKRAAIQDVRFEADQPNIPAPAAAAMDVETTTPTALSIHDHCKSQPIDEGYIPTDDGLTEEESKGNRVNQGRSIQHRSTNTNTPLEVAEAPSIDEGYIPDTETIRMRSPRRAGAGIDAGYLPDGGHTTAGEATAEEDYQGDEAAVGRQQAAVAAAARGVEKDLLQEEEQSLQDDVIMDKISHKKKEESSPQQQEVNPTDTRLDDTIDEGYLPSAVEGTEEEELSEKEETARTILIANNNNADTKEAQTEPFSPPSGTNEDNRETTRPSVLVATATALQQQHDGDGSSEPVLRAASLSMKSVEEDDEIKLSFANDSEETRSMPMEDSTSLTHKSLNRADNQVAAEAVAAGAPGDQNILAVSAVEKFSDQDIDGKVLSEEDAEGKKSDSTAVVFEHAAAMEIPVTAASQVQEDEDDTDDVMAEESSEKEKIAEPMAAAPSHFDVALKETFLTSDSEINLRTDPAGEQVSYRLTALEQDQNIVDSKDGMENDSEKKTPDPIAVVLDLVAMKNLATANPEQQEDEVGKVDVTIGENDETDKIADSTAAAPEYGHVATEENFLTSDSKVDLVVMEDDGEGKQSKPAAFALKNPVSSAPEHKEDEDGEVDVMVEKNNEKKMIADMTAAASKHVDVAMEEKFSICDSKIDSAHESESKHLTPLDQDQDNDDKVVIEEDAVGEESERTAVVPVATENIAAAAPEHIEDEDGQVDGTTEMNDEMDKFAGAATSEHADVEMGKEISTIDSDISDGVDTMENLPASLEQHKVTTEDIDGGNVAESLAVATYEVVASLDIDGEETKEAGVKNTDDANKKAVGVSAKEDENGMEPAKADEENAKYNEELSRLTVVQLRKRLRALNLPVSGRKLELIDRLHSHLYPSVEEAEDESENAAADADESKAASKSSRKRKASSASVGSKQKSRNAEAATPSSKMSSALKSKGDKVVDQAQQNTPISVLSHPASDYSGTDDESAQEVQEQHFASETATRSSRRAKSGSSPGVPTSIVTLKRGGNNSPSMPVLPEGETVEVPTVQENIGVAVKGAKIEAKVKSEETSSTKSTRSKRSTRQSKNDDEGKASGADISGGSTTRRGKRSAGAVIDNDDASYVSDASKKARRSTRASKGTEETNKESEAPKRGRGGRARKNKAEADDQESASTKRSARNTSKKSEESESSTKRRTVRSRAKKDKAEIDATSVASTRRSVRSVAKKGDESASVGTRRSTRSRIKKG